MEDSKENLKPATTEGLGQAKEAVAETRQEIQERKEAINRQDLQKAKELIEGMQTDDDVKAQTAAAAQTLAGAEEQEKMAQLLKLAKIKGVIFAVKTAQKMNDPYLLDMLHDKLAENGHYKDFLK